MNSLRKISILDVRITDASYKEVLEYILGNVKDKSQKLKIYTPNPEMIVYATRHPEFKTILNSADIAIPDGIGLILAAKLLGVPLKERISGIDLMESICSAANGKPVSVGLLGAKPGVAERTAECLLLKFPNLNIVFASDEWGEEGFNFNEKYEVLSSKYKVEKKDHSSKFRVQSSIDILFVAYGVPKQEIWISENIEKLPVKVMMGVGGAFDILSGDIKRAPEFIQKLGLEWLYRLILEPWRWKRQLALLSYIKIVLKEKLNYKT